MKTTYFRILFLLLLLAPIPAYTATPELKEFVQTIEQTFPLQKNGLVYLHNQYGLIEIRAHDKPEVELVVKLRVKAPSESRANNVFDKIDIDMESSPQRIYVETKINESRSSSFLNMLTSWNNSNDNFQIDYYLLLPYSCQLESHNKYGNTNILSSLEGPTRLYSKYGNINTQDFTEELELSISYGNLKMGALLGPTQLSLDYIDRAHIDQLNIADCELSYAQLSIGKCVSLALESKYSKLYAQDIDELDYEGKYDDISIENLTTAIIESKYTGIAIGSIADKLHLENSYGELYIGHILASASNILIDADYMSSELDLKDLRNYTLDIETAYTGVKVENIADLVDVNKSFDNTNKDLHGIRGNGHTKIEIYKRYGNLRIR